jgi:hypothetical protein
MQTLSAFGSLYFYVAALLLIYWCVDEKLGARLSILLLISGCLNQAAKDFFRQPRPYDLDSRVALGRETSYGFPSGHAQNSLLFWGFLAKNHIKIWFAVVLITLAIGFSRLYLGLHFPTDLAGGWLLAILLLIMYHFAKKLHLKCYNSFPLLQDQRIQMFMVALAALLMNQVSSDVRISGMFLGFGLGYVLETKKVGFSAGAAAGTASGRPGIARLALRYITGIAVLAALYTVLLFILPGAHSLFGQSPTGQGPMVDFWGARSPYFKLGTFVLNAAVGFWASYGAPAFFVRMGLAGKHELAGKHKGFEQ